MDVRSASLLLLATLASGCTPEAAPSPVPGPAPVDTVGRAEEGPPYVVMVSLDGMRHDFADRVPTPNLDRLAATGVKARGLIPSYPSKTFPNHYTLATGLYPADHGIVDNAFYDPAFDAIYALGDSETVRDGRWYGGEPIWVTAERQGLVTASFFWVGTEAEIDGVRPTYFKYYDGDLPYPARVDTVLHWLSLPEPQRPRLVLLYFSEPDHTAHVLGPEDPAVDSVVAAMDVLVGRLMDGIARLPIADRVNLLVMSDHGMAPVPSERVVYLEDVVDLDGVRVINNTTQTFLYFDGDESRLWAVYEVLQERLTNARVYLREETPERLHYRDSRRIGDLVVVAEPGWVIGSREGREWTGGGMHGWDPYWRLMHGTFVAAGPGLVEGARLPAFQNVHVYPLVAHLLGLDPAAGIDGRLEVLDDALANPATAERR